MNPLEELLAKLPVVISDGALATELERRGMDIDNALWSASALITRPELIKEIHLDYLKAGANIVTSSSYQATIEGFMKCGKTHQEAADLISSSVQIAKEVVRKFQTTSSHVQPIIVAASIGSYGAFLADGSEYRGNYSIGFEELKEFHRERLKILVDSEPDIIICEVVNWPELSSVAICFSTPCISMPLTARTSYGHSASRAFRHPH